MTLGVSMMRNKIKIALDASNACEKDNIYNKNDREHLFVDFHWNSCVKRVLTKYKRKLLGKYKIMEYAFRLKSTLIE